MVSIDITHEHMEKLSKASQDLGIPMQALIDSCFNNFFEFQVPSIINLKNELNIRINRVEEINKNTKIITESDTQ